MLVQVQLAAVKGGYSSMVEHPRVFASTHW